MDLLVIRTVTGDTGGVVADTRGIQPCTHPQTHMSGAGTMCTLCGTVLTANGLKLEQTYQQNQHYFCQYRRITRSKATSKHGVIKARNDVLSRILLEKFGPDGQPPPTVVTAARTMFEAITGDERLHRFLCSDTMSMTNGSRGKALVMIILLRVLRNLKLQKRWMSEHTLIEVFCLPKKFATRALNIVAAWDRKIYLSGRLVLASVPPAGNG